MTKYPATMTWRNASYLPVGFNLNNLLGGSGFFEVDTPTNGPGTGVWFVTVIKSGVDGKVSHRAVAKANADFVYERNFNGSTWSTWVAPSKMRNTSVAAKTTSTTLTAAEIVGGLLTANQAAAGAANYTLPLAADLDTYLQSPAVGTTFEFTLLNLSAVDAEDATVVTNTGWTLVGSMLVESTGGVPAGPPRGTFIARRTGTAAWTLYRKGN